MSSIVVVHCSRSIALACVNVARARNASQVPVWPLLYSSIKSSQSKSSTSLHELCLLVNPFHLTLYCLTPSFTLTPSISSIFECCVVLVAAPELACSRLPVWSAHKHKESIRGLQNFP